MAGTKVPAIIFWFDVRLAAHVFEPLTLLTRIMSQSQALFSEIPSQKFLQTIQRRLEIPAFLV